MIRSSILTLGTLALIAGCNSGGEVHDRQQTQNVSPDGKTATQTRTQVRETPSGATVKETQVQTREVIQPGPTTMPDARQRDPAR
jgi:hypothetical protein